MKRILEREQIEKDVLTIPQYEEINALGCTPEEREIAIKLKAEWNRDLRTRMRSAVHIPWLYFKDQKRAQNLLESCVKAGFLEFFPDHENKETLGEFVVLTTKGYEFTYFVYFAKYMIHELGTVPVFVISIVTSLGIGQFFPIIWDIIVKHL